MTKPTQKTVEAELAHYRRTLAFIKAELEFRVSIKEVVGTEHYFQTRITPFGNIASDDLIEYAKWIESLLNTATSMVTIKPPKEVAEVLAYAEHFFGPIKTSGVTGVEEPLMQNVLQEIVGGQFRQLAQKRALDILRPKLRKMKYVLYFKWTAFFAAAGLAFYAVRHWLH